MSRHRKQRRPYGQPASSPLDPVPTSPSPSANPPQRDAHQAELAALREQIAQTRREINARLDALAASIEGLLADHSAAQPPPAPPQPAPLPVTTTPPALPPLRPGDEVYVPHLGGTYRVLEVAPHGRAFTVQTGTMRVQVRRDEAWTLNGDTPSAPSGKAAGRGASRPEFNAAIEELDLHGFTEDDALITLELFLQQAYARRIARVRVIHGKGNGVLRAAVRRELAHNQLVRAVDSGPHFRGDDGVTLADLDL